MQVALCQPLAPARKSRRHPALAFHATLLVLSAGVIFLSCILQVVSDRHVQIPVINVVLPGTCTYQQLFGIDCPGCGLTRCFVSIGHGNFADAWRFNPAGLLGYVLVVSQIPYRIAQWIRVRRGQRELQLSWMGQAIFWAFFALLLAQWIARMYFGF